MQRRSLLTTCGGLLSVAASGCLRHSDTGPEGFEIEEVATGLTHPWAIAFLPDDSRVLVTEREGSLQLLDREDGSLQELSNVPSVTATGQGGLLDVALHPDFADHSWVYLTYSATNESGESSTHLGRGRLDFDEPALEDWEQLHVAEPFLDSTNHYGSRVEFGPDEFLYLTVGDRARKDFGPDHVSQDLSNELGTTLRLTPDGAIPTDNPFVDEAGALDSIYSYGHRNAQGMAIHPETGQIWQSEHGERDGDELNIIEFGGNYGWPIAHHGCRYGTEDPVGDKPEDLEGVVNPVYFWECTSGGFPPAGMTFYTGRAFPEWEGDLFVGNLASRYLGHFSVDGRTVEELDPLLADQGWRIRDVAVAPDTEHLYVAVDDGDAPIVRLLPE